MGITVGELAEHLGLDFRGDPDVRIDHAASLRDAGPGSLTFLADPRYRSYLAATNAGLVVLNSELAPECPTNVLLSNTPHLSFARALELVIPRGQPAAGVHETAVVEAGVTLGHDVHVGAHAYIATGCSLGNGAEIGPGCVLLRGASVGARTRLVARVTLGEGSVIGEDCLIQPGAVLGADGFGFAHHEGQWIKVPQVGRVVLGHRVEIGSNTTIDRGAIGNTEIGDGVKIDNLVQIGHNCRVGTNTIITGCTGVAGSTEIGSNCAIGGMTGIAGHIRIVDGVQVTGMTQITKSLLEPGVYSSGTGVEPNRRWRRNAARFHQLDSMAKRLRELEARLNGMAGPESPGEQ